MNTNITYIKDNLANTVECLPTTALSSYLLTEEEHQYIANLLDETNSIISNQLLTASIKAGSSLYTQPELNKIYARRENSGYKQSDRSDFKDFINTKMVGNMVISFPELGE